MPQAFQLIGWHHKDRDRHALNNLAVPSLRNSPGSAGKKGLSASIQYKSSEAHRSVRYRTWLAKKKRPAGRMRRAFKETAMPNFPIVAYRCPHPGAERCQHAD